MIQKDFTIEVDGTPAGLNGVAKATLSANLIPHSKEMDTITHRPAVIICPGGGYAFVSEREGDPVARQFMAAGFQTFVLWYTVKELPFPSHLLCAAKAIALVREHAAEWDIDPNRIVIAGFSAGGHLAATAGMLWNRDYVKNTLQLFNGEHRPDGMILSYPVITSGEYAHRGSFQNLLNKSEDPALLKETSMELQVSEDTVPAFVWHTYTDGSVPVENSLMLATALRQHNIPLELHIFPRGWHGLSTVLPEVSSGPAECRAWVEMAIRWVNNLSAE